MADIWRENTYVRFGDVDRSDRLTLGSIFSFFQEAAISHATDLGVGRDLMAKAGQGWILSRLSLFVERRPAYGEKIEISSWPRGWEKLFALRDYTIRDAEGLAIVRGRGAWLILDINRRKPLRAQSAMGSLPPNDGIDAFSTVPSGLAARENLSKAGERKALYSDIDFYGHVNNARYIQWIQDITQEGVLADADQIRLDIDYLSEVLPGETVELWTTPLDDALKGDGEKDFPCRQAAAFVFEGRRPGSEQAVFRAELRTGKRQREL